MGRKLGNRTGRCEKCGRSSPDVHFKLYRWTTVDGIKREAPHRLCWHCYQEKYRKIYGNSKYARRGHLARYGISESEYNSLREKQNFKCAICGKHETEILKGSSGSSTTALNIDHCHETGRVRGLICANCNKAIGHFYDNPLFLHNAIKYLEGV